MKTTTHRFPETFSRLEISAHENFWRLVIKTGNKKGNIEINITIKLKNYSKLRIFIGE